MSDKRRQANRGEGLPSFSDNPYSVAEADPEAFEALVPRGMAYQDVEVPRG